MIFFKPIKISGNHVSGLKKDKVFGEFGTYFFFEGQNRSLNPGSGSDGRLDIGVDIRNVFFCLLTVSKVILSSSVWVCSSSDWVCSSSVWVCNSSDCVRSSLAWLCNTSVRSATVASNYGFGRFTLRVFK